MFTDDELLIAAEGRKMEALHAYAVRKRLFMCDLNITEMLRLLNEALKNVGLLA